MTGEVHWLLRLPGVGGLKGVEYSRLGIANLIVIELEFSAKVSRPVSWPHSLSVHHQCQAILYMGLGRKVAVGCSLAVEVVCLASIYALTQTKGLSGWFKEVHSKLSEPTIPQAAKPFVKKELS